MNVLFICDEYPPGKTGGIGSAVQLLARALARQGCGVFVAGLYDPNFGGKTYEEEAGIKIWRHTYGTTFNIPDWGYRIYKNLPDIIKRNLNGKKAFERFIFFLNSLIEKERIDIIEIADWNTFSVHIGFNVEWPAFKAPLVVKSHGSYSKIYYDLGKVPAKKFRMMDEHLFKRADAISAVSSDTAALNKKIFRIEKDIKVLHNAVEIPDIRVAEKRYSNKVVFAGSLTSAKGVHQLLKAWNLVAVEMPEAVLTLYGKGKIEPLKQILTDNVRKTVEFKGFLPREQLLEQFGRYSVAVFPSFSETFGLTAIEAMSMACPVIFSEKGAGKEIITHGVDGLLINPGDEHQIAQAILTLLRDPEMRETFSRNGRETVVKKFDIRQSAKDHLDFYSRVIETFKRKKSAHAEIG